MISRFFVLFICCLLGVSACSVHHPAVHLYDGAHKDERKLAALWDFNGEGFTVDGQSISHYLPQKPSLGGREKFDEYFLLPGKRHFVFPIDIIIGFREREICTTTECSPDEKYCTPIESCSTEKVPRYKRVHSEEISLQLEAGHKYFITIEYTKPPTVDVRDLGVNPKLTNPIAIGASINSEVYKKVINEGKIINY
jgi:hypothetical protein